MSAMLPFDTLDPARYPLALAPSDATGWFSGTPLIALDPVVRETGVPIARAAGMLEATFAAEEFGVTAALIGYDGVAEVRTYGGAHTFSGTAWIAHGDVSSVPGPLVAERSMRRGRAQHAPLLRVPRFDMDEQGWTGRVHAVQEEIRRGEVYVLNLTMRLTGTARLTPPEAFARLHLNPGGPMAALLASPETAVVSVSPERFLGVTLGWGGASRSVQVWPIKGTRPRGTNGTRDSELARALAADEKERAEHVMIVDMERNDLGRVCKPGSVGVDPLMEVFATPYCHQMASCVSGELRADASFAELLEAAFPCGSVTGAPKVAAMRIIERLETGPRGAYTGALLVAMPGRLDSSVLIRTLEYLPDGSAVWGTGSGITIDSDPAAEWREARLKASPVLD